MWTLSLLNKACIVAVLSVAVALPAHASSKKGKEPLPAPAVKGIALKAEPDLELTRKPEVNPYADIVVHPVSVYDYNRLVFSEPAARIFVSDESSLVEPPEYLAGNTSALILFNKRQNKRPIQVLVNFKSGGSATLYVRPGEVPGAVIQVENKESGSTGKASATKTAEVSDARAASGFASYRRAALNTLKGLVQGMVPEGYHPLPLPAPTVFDRYTVHPELAATDGSTAVYVFQLISAKGKSSVVAPNQFYRPGIEAVLIDGDRLDEANPRRVYLVEDVSNVR